MGIAFLAPVAFAGLIAVAVPIVVHLTNRDRRDVVRFPSLKFLTRLPYRQMRRQRIQHWFLFAMRTLAIVLLVAAFSRPLVEEALLPGTDESPGRELVVALDRSYSMGYGETWERAVDAVTEAVSAQPPNSRLSLITFDEHAQVVAGPVTDPTAILQALDTLSPGARGTRLAAAIQMANHLLLEAPLDDREVVLISDWQQGAWDRANRTRLVAGTKLTPVDLSTGSTPNALIASVEVHRGDNSDRPSIRVAVRVINQGPDSIDDLPVELIIDGQAAAQTSVSLPPTSSATAWLGPVAHPSAQTRATVQLAGDRLAADNEFHFVLSSRPELSALLIEDSGAPAQASLYLREALSIAQDPAMEVIRARSNRVRPDQIASATVIILHDSPFPAGPAGPAIIEHVARGGGLWIVLGGHSSLASWPETASTIMPGRWRSPVDRLDTQGVGLASIDYDHPAFRIFRGPDDGNVASPRFYRYRPILPADSAATLARYADGAVALAGIEAGGQVLMWGSPFDNQWSDLPVHPVFLPFVHQVMQFLGGVTRDDTWRMAGQVVDVGEVLAQMGLDSDTLGRAMIIEGPSGNRREVDTGGSEPFVTLEEAGFYSWYPLGRERASYPVAVNVDRTESELASLDIEAFVAGATEPDTSGAVHSAAAGGQLTPADRERRQGIWWFLIAGALALLVIESVWSNRPTQSHPAATRQHAARAQ